MKMASGALPARSAEALGAVVALALLTGCGTRLPTAAAPAAVSQGTRPQTQAFVATIRARGWTAAIAEEMPASSFPFFAEPASRVEAGGASLFCFEYGEAAAAEMEASRISADGYQVGLTKVDWVSEPHFYRADRLIVLYVGRSREHRGLLESVLGPQIAGAP